MSINNVKTVFNNLFIEYIFDDAIHDLLKKHYFLKSIKIIINSLDKINTFFIIIQLFKINISKTIYYLTQLTKILKIEL